MNGRIWLSSFACAIALVASSARVFVAQAPDDAPAPPYKSNLPADDPAIQYGRAKVDDAASRLAVELAAGPPGFVPSGDRRSLVTALLHRLDVDTGSQMLVFSKTSFQAPRISPRKPRAIYFNDDVMVGYVPGAPTLEIAAVDPVNGPVFYTMTSGGAGNPVITRSGACLRCHQGPNTAGVPGIYVGSVVPGPTGAPLRDDSAIITDHRSPFRARWGGWYVTAKSGEQPDRANAVASNPADPATLVRDARQNLTTLAPFFDGSAYPAGSSDIVALMTFEHQTQMTNLITRVGWEARILDDMARPVQGRDLRRADSPAPPVSESMLEADIEDLVEYMLFSGEAPLTEPIEGVSAFTETFPRRGPKDHLGRSLRDFDLKTRLFRFPLSYMIYSASFDALPANVRDRIYRRLFEVLSGADRSPAFAHLSSSSRRAILEILRDTKRGLPGYFGGGSRRP